MTRPSEQALCSIPVLLRRARPGGAASQVRSPRSRAMSNTFSGIAGDRVPGFIAAQLARAAVAYLVSRFWLHD